MDDEGRIKCTTNGKSLLMGEDTDILQIKQKPAANTTIQFNVVSQYVVLKVVFDTFH